LEDQVVSTPVVELNKLMYSPDEMAALLGLSPRFIFERIRSREIRAVKMGHKWKVSIDELQRLQRDGLPRAAE
jgi:excisionase family DNA binding protein